MNADKKKELWKPSSFHSEYAKKKFCNFIKEYQKFEGQAEKDHLLHENRDKKNSTKSVGDEDMMPDKDSCSKCKFRCPYKVVRPKAFRC